MSGKIVLFVLGAFILGILCSLIYVDFSAPQGSVTTMTTFRQSDIDENILTAFGLDNAEQASPYDWIEESMIKVYHDKIVIDLENAEWARFTDTNSMDPVIDAGANAIEIVPESYNDVHVGDIVSYRSKYSTGFIIHRVVETGFDEDGWYAIMKGDNNPRQDPGKVRFSEVERIVVAIIY